MSNHADTIRRYIADASDWADAGVGNAEAYEREGLAALDALVAQNQRLRDALERCAVSSIATPGEAQLIARAALYGTPSAAQTLEDTPTTERAEASS